MIEEVTMYRAVCDRCGISEFGWRDKDEAIKEVIDDGWKEINGKLLCPDCYEEELKNDNE